MAFELGENVHVGQVAELLVLRVAGGALEALLGAGPARVRLEGHVAEQAGELGHGGAVRLQLLFRVRLAQLADVFLEEMAPLSVVLGGAEDGLLLDDGEAPTSSACSA